MDLDMLQSRLYDEKLVIGDICETTKTFFKEYEPAPIGFISVDVDVYTPTVAILEMLTGDHKYFLCARKLLDSSLRLRCQSVA
jgi:hypothetical protein